MNRNFDFLSLLRKKPQAFASVMGSPDFPDIKGRVLFYQINAGVVVMAQVWGLPKDKDILAFHIHSGSSCTGNKDDYFADAMTHYNPDKKPHPYHAGDMPPLFNADGVAYSLFLTNRFLVKDIIGRTVIIHSSPDDFTTQPSGNSGTKIACGVIKKW